VHRGAVGHGVETLEDHSELAVDLGLEGLEPRIEKLAGVLDGGHCCTPVGHRNNLIHAEVVECQIPSNTL
jgi:hypothetical protein